MKNNFLSKVTFLTSSLIWFLCLFAIAEGGVETFVNRADRAFYSKFHKNEENGLCTALVMEWVKKFRGFQDDSSEAIHITKKRAILPMGDSMKTTLNDAHIFEIYGRKEDLVRAHINLLCKELEDVSQEALEFVDQEETPEIHKIVNGGDQANRIDVVFMGDGYTADERQRFFEDMDRLTQDMFEGATFRSYLPLFNIWAVFVPSVDSGIGYNGPKNTPFKLYRESGQLRVIYPGNTSYAREVCRLTGTSGCDYPSLIANDDYYGGVGGEFVVSTRSNRTGIVVLRHEMGHSFIDVGDEYDNSWAYGGVNSASSVASLGWTHWLSGSQREELAIYRLLEYPWHDLSQGEITFRFVSDGRLSRWYLLASVSAAGEEDSLEFRLDDEILPWVSSGFDDREFYSWRGEQGFTNGIHSFSVRSKTNSTNPDIPRMICHITLHEYGNEDEFEASNDYVSAYPTWDVDRRKTFRPTNEGCLMRNMSHNSLCNICREGMWYEFLKKVSLIDNVTVADGNPNESRIVTLSTLQLAQFRQPGNEVIGEELKVRWYRNNVEQEELMDEFEVTAEPGNWRVEADFITPEVRRDPTNLLKDSVTFTV